MNEEDGSGDRQYDYSPNAVQCIRCDEETNEYQTLFYSRETEWLHMCPECFEEVENRGG